MDLKLCACGAEFTPNSYQQLKCNDCRFAPKKRAPSHKKTQVMKDNREKAWHCRDTRDWRAIPGYEGRYEISDYGDVLSLVKGRRILRPTRFDRGYKLVLSNRTGARAWHTVQRLMLLTFRPIEDAHLYTAAAKDDTHDMSLKNWYWAKRQGEHANRTKLNAAQVINIKARLMADSALSYRVIAQEYNVSLSAISHIMTGANWKHVS